MLGGGTDPFPSTTGAGTRPQKEQQSAKMRCWEDEVHQEGQTRPHGEEEEGDGVGGTLPRSAARCRRDGKGHAPRHTVPSTQGLSTTSAPEPSRLVPIGVSARGTAGPQACSESLEIRPELPPPYKHHLASIPRGFQNQSINK